MIKWVLALLLVQPSTGLERTTFVIVDTEQQCVFMRDHALKPMHRDKYPRPNRWDVSKAKCEPIDMSAHAF